MPQPDYQPQTADWYEQPHTPTEVLGRGPEARKSKTYIKDPELASLLGFIRLHTDRLFKYLRRLHAAHNTIPVEVEDPNGDTVIEHQPEILTDDQLRHHYPILEAWERGHQEQVDHYASIDGFSVKQISGIRDDDDRPKRTESSAGADAPKNGAGNIGQEARWR